MGFGCPPRGRALGAERPDHCQVDQVDKGRADDRHDNKGWGDAWWGQVNACILAIAVAVAPPSQSPQKASEMTALS
jgi:hypothetical protein